MAALLRTFLYLMTQSGRLQRTLDPSLVYGSGRVQRDEPGTVVIRQIDAKEKVTTVSNRVI